MTVPSSGTNTLRNADVPESPSRLRISGSSLIWLSLARQPHKKHRMAPFASWHHPLVTEARREPWWPMVENLTLLGRFVFFSDGLCPRPMVSRRRLLAPQTLALHGRSRSQLVAKGCGGSVFGACVGFFLQTPMFGARQRLFRPLCALPSPLESSGPGTLQHSPPQCHC